MWNTRLSNTQILSNAKDHADIECPKSNRNIAPKNGLETGIHIGNPTQIRDTDFMGNKTNSHVVHYETKQFVLVGDTGVTADETEYR